MAPILPFLSEQIYQNLVVSNIPSLPDSVHLTSWPTDDMASHRDEGLERSMAVVRRAVELARTVRSRAGLRMRQPVRRMWLALPPGVELDEELLGIMSEELNVKESIHLIQDGSDLVERRVKPLLPVIGPRLGSKIPAIMAAARANEVEYLPGGGVRVAGVDLAADEVEIMATPRPGTAVAHDEGVVVVIDTEIDDALRAEGDVRELSRAVQELRKQVGLDLDEMIELWLHAPAQVLAQLEPYLGRLAEDTLADAVYREAPPQDSAQATQDVNGGQVAIALRGRRGPS
jgi:isoleucyl-tRNA synthetase